MWGTEGTRWNVDRSNSFRGNAHALVKIPFIEGLSYRFNYSQIGDFVDNERFDYEGYFISEGDSPDRYSSSALQGLLSKANGSMTKRREIVGSLIILSTIKEFLEMIIIWM